MALGSVAVGLVVFGLKFLAFWLTGSVALYSDALESIINIVAAGAALLARAHSWFTPARRPPFVRNPNRTKGLAIPAVIDPPTRLKAGSPTRLECNFERPFASTSANSGLRLGNGPSLR